MKEQNCQYICPYNSSFNEPWADEITKIKKHRYGGMKMKKLLNELVLEKERTGKNLEKVKNTLLRQKQKEKWE